MASAPAAVFELPPLDGGLSFGQGVQLGYLAQLRGAAIPGATVLDALLAAWPVVPGEARSYLARFLFRGDDVFRSVGVLSGGYGRDELERSGAYRVYDDPADLHAHLDELGIRPEE